MNKMGSGWPKREPPIKSRPDIEAALAAHNRIQATSDEIRERHGLPPVPENEAVRSWRARLAASPTKAPTKLMTPEQRLDAIAKRRGKLARERGECDRELAELARSRELGVTRIAEGVGVTRQAIYQLASA